MSALLKPGHNCWRIERVNRFALLVDGADYYTTLAESFRLAQRWVAWLAWDLDTRTHLIEHDPDRLTGSLQQFLRGLVAQNPELTIAILPWDFPLLFANVRDPKLVRGEDPFKHPRICIHPDNLHPWGGSHHQKIVAIDGTLAFSGGMDLAGGRWDTSEHRSQDPRRGYPPTHDVQVMVDGDAARALAEIVRDRWQRATGKILPHSQSGTDAWPTTVAPDLTGVAVGISRTDPLSGCREVEALHLDLIASAREFLYIENQYLTSSQIVEALCRRLQEQDGPEIVIILPLNNHGWIEDHTIEVLRYRRIRALHRADRFDRLRICYPTSHDINNEHDESIVVHSKITVVDDRLFRVGSSNLTARSMSLDTECDLTVEAESPDQRRGIARLRNRLLGEHLGLTPGEVAEGLAEQRSMIRLIDMCSSRQRCLRELPDEGGATQIIPDALIDPAEPMTPAYVIRTLGQAASRSRGFWAVAAVALGITGAVASRPTASRSRQLRAPADDRKRRG